MATTLRIDGKGRGWLAMLALIAGCGGIDPVEETWKSPTPSPKAGDPFDLEGLFAMRNVLVQYVETTPGSFERQSIVTYSLSTLTPGTTENTVLYREQDCLIEMSDVSGASQSVDEDLPALTPAIDYTVTLSAPVIGATFTLEPQVELKGCVLDDPWHDALPTDPYDERVTDFDHDGNPGYTVYVDYIFDATVWTAQRYIFEFDGVIAGADVITGLTYPDLETSKLWASTDLIPLDTGTYVSETPEDSFFEMQRVVDSYTCDQLVANKDTLFPQ